VQKLYKNLFVLGAPPQTLLGSSAYGDPSYPPAGAAAPRPSYLAPPSTHPGNTIGLQTPLNKSQLQTFTSLLDYLVRRTMTKTDFINSATTLSHDSTVNKNASICRVYFRPLKKGAVLPTAIVKKG